MAKFNNAVLDCLEPRSHAVEDEERVAVSFAISLKRIADALNEPNEYGEIGSAAIAGAIVRGLRDR